MSVNKVIYAGNTLIDLTSDTVSESSLLKGRTAHDKSGKVITGTYEAGEAVENILEDGFSSGDVTYVESYNQIVATNNTTGQILTKVFTDDSITVTLTENDSVIGTLTKTYNDNLSVITSVNTYTGYTNEKTFDYTNHTMTSITKDSAGNTIKSITKHLNA